MKAFLLAALAIAPGAACASIEIADAPIDPVGDTYEAVVISTVVHGGNTITLTLGASSHTPSDPVVRNLGGGVYGVASGASAGGGGGSGSGAAGWDFDFSAEIDGPGSFADYRLVLNFDRDPLTDTPFSQHGAWDLTMWAHDNGADLSATRVIEGSENLASDYLSTPQLGVVAPPAAGFDPNAHGEYTFQLRVLAPFIGGEQIDSVTALARVLPEPATASLWCGLAGALTLLTTRRRTA